MRTCSLCNRSVSDSDIWCGVCGKKLVWGFYDSSSKETKKPEAKKADNSSYKQNFTIVEENKNPAPVSTQPVPKKTLSVRINTLKPGSLDDVKILMTCLRCKTNVASLQGRCLKCGGSCTCSYENNSFLRVFNAANEKGTYNFYFNGINMINLRPNEYTCIYLDSQKAKIEIVSDKGKASLYTALQPGEIRHILISDKKSFRNYQLNVRDVSSEELDNILSRYSNTKHIIMKDKYKEPYHYYPPCVDGLN